MRTNFGLGLLLPLDPRCLLEFDQRFLQIVDHALRMRDAPPARSNAEIDILVVRHLRASNVSFDKNGQNDNGETRNELVDPSK